MIRTLDDAWAEWPATMGELARSLGLSREGLRQLQAGRHVRPPVALLRKFAEVLRRRGTATGVEPPDGATLVRLWKRDRDRAAAGAG